MAILDGTEHDESNFFNLNQSGLRQFTWPAILQKSTAI
jgi:hypothetical protein